MRTSHKLWVDYPAFLSLPPNAAPEGPSKRSTLPPTPKLPPPVVGAMGAAEAALDAATATLAMVVAVAQVVVVVSTPGGPVQVLALAALGTPLAFVAATTKDVMAGLWS